MDQINLAVEHLGKFNALFGAEAAFHEVVCGETVFDGQLGAALANSIHDHEGKTGAVFQAAAVLVGAVVIERGHELTEKPTVRAMDLYHIVPAVLCHFSGAGIGFDELEHNVFGHFRSHDAIGVFECTGGIKLAVGGNR